MKKRVTLEDLDNFASNLYCTPEDVYRISPLTRKSTKELVKEIIEDMRREGLPPISLKTQMVPTYRVMEKLGLKRNG